MDEITLVSPTIRALHDAPNPDTFVGDTYHLCKNAVIEKRAKWFRKQVRSRGAQMSLQSARQVATRTAMFLQELYPGPES